LGWSRSYDRRRDVFDGYAAAVTRRRQKPGLQVEVIGDVPLLGWKPKTERQRRADKALRQHLDDKSELLQLQLEAARERRLEEAFRPRWEDESELGQLQFEAARHAAADQPRRGRKPGQPTEGDVKKALKLLTDKRKREQAGLPESPAHTLRAIAKASGVDRYWITKWWGQLPMS
jgi:hypothetical protein